MNWIADDNQTIPPDASIDYKYAAGLDYLNGYDCAVRHEKAVALIREAAEAGHEEAMCTMADLHRSGIGIGLTYQGEILWLSKLADMAEERYYTEFHREYGDTCCRYLEQLFTACFAYDQFPQAQEAGERWHRLATDMEERYFTVFPLVTAELRLSDLFFHNGQNEMALMYCQSAYDRLLPLCRADQLPKRPAIYAVAAVDRMERLMFILGKDWSSSKEKEEALSLEERAACCEDPEPLYHNFLALKLRANYPMRSYANDRVASWEEQRSVYHRAVDALEKYVEENPASADKEELAEKYMEFAYVCSSTYNHDRAIKYYEKAYALWKALFDKHPGGKYQYLMARCLRLQIPPLLCLHRSSQAERNAYLACSMVAQLRDPALTNRCKCVLTENYKEIYTYYLDHLILDCAENITCKIAVLEAKSGTIDAAAHAYMHHLINLTKKGNEKKEQKHYSYAISYYNAAILFADLFRRRLPLLASKTTNGIRLVITGTVIRLYKSLGAIEYELGNKNAGRECNRMARYIK